MKQLFVDSRDRTRGTSTSFSITLPQTLVTAPGQRMRVDNLRVPNVMNLITTNVNDRLYVKIGNTTYTALLSQGTMDGPDLAAHIQNRLQLAVNAGTFTVEWLAYNWTMRILYTVPFVLLTDAQLAAAGNLNPMNFATRLFSHDYTYQTAPGGDTQLLFSYVSLTPCDIVYLCCSQFATTDVFGPKGANDVLIGVVIEVPFGEIIVGSMSYEVWSTIPAMTCQQLDFQLRDRDYNLLTNLPNISFQITIS
jgi:hypothetical protein